MKDFTLGSAVGSLYVAVDDRDINLFDVNARNRASMENLIEKYNSLDQPGSAGDQCRPWNYQDYLARLHSFHNASDWFAKPETVGAPECALRGWWNCGRDKLQCKSCGAKIEHGNDDLDGGFLLLSLTDGHTDSCGWKTLSCETSFLELQDTRPLSLNRSNITRIRDSLVSIDYHQPTLKLAVQFPIDELEWIKSFDVMVEGGSCLIHFPTRQALAHILTAVSAVHHTISAADSGKSVSSASKRDRPDSLNEGTLLDLILSNTQESSCLPSLAGVLLLSVFGWTIKPSNQQLCASCSLCNRSIPLSDNNDSKSFHVVNQHKPYCSFVRPQAISSSSLSSESDSHYSEGVRGYKLVLTALTLIKEYPVKKSNTSSSSSSIAGSEVNPVAIEAQASAEQSYKKIRLVLNSAV